MYASDIFQVLASQGFTVDYVFERAKVAGHLADASVVDCEFIEVDLGQNSRTPSEEGSPNPEAI
jgi:hypothetical protein